MPWRTIDATATVTGAGGATTEPVPTRRPSPGTLAVLGATGLIAVAALALAFGSGAVGSVGATGAIPIDPAGVGASGESGGPDARASESMVVVEIIGAVIKPGVYRLPTGSRVDDLVLVAGGFGPRVDTARAAVALNRAAVLSDGSQIRVPSRDDPQPSEGGSWGAVPDVGGAGGAGAGGAGVGGATSVDLNTATSSELEALPGIGPVTANKIIASREEARFATVDDLRTRKLLGEKTFDGLKDLVTVR